MIKRYIFIILLIHFSLFGSIWSQDNRSSNIYQFNHIETHHQAQKQQLEAADTLDISIPSDLNGAKNSMISIPININDPLENYKISTYQFVITYDPNILLFQNASDVNSLTESWEGPYAEVLGSGKITVGGFGVQPLNCPASPPPLVYLNFLIIGPPESASSLHFDSFDVDAIGVAVRCHDGLLKVMPDSNAVTVLVKSDRFGPGHKGKAIEIDLKNSMGIFGVQFSVKFDSSLLKCIKVDTTSRSAKMQIASKIWPDSANVLIFSATGDSLMPGHGSIVKLVMNINGNAPAGDSSRVYFGQIKISGKHGKKLVAIGRPGFIYFGLKGDINNDGVIDIYDVTILVDIILGNYQPTAYEFWAADMDDSGEVDIYDLIQLIEIVRNGRRPRPAYPKAIALATANNQIHLPNVMYVPGEATELPIVASFDGQISGLQMRVKYQPDVLKILAPRLTDLTNHMNFACSDKNGEFTILIFSSNGYSFSANDGSIVTLPVQVLKQVGSSLPLIINEAIAINCSGEKIIIPVESEHSSYKVTKDFYLGQNYPNPFNSETCIEFQIPEAGHATLKIYNLLGEEVRTLINSHLKGGAHKIMWDGKMNNGSIAPSGCYIYCLAHNRYKNIRRSIIQK